MTITPAQFGLDIDNGAVKQHCLLVLPAIEAPAEWSDSTEKVYHRCRARANVDVAGGDTLYIKYRLDESSDQFWPETHAGAIADAWTSTWAAANETPDHVDHSDAIPNPTPADVSHRYVVARIDWWETGAGTPVVNMIHLGWPNDTAIGASDPDIELTARTTGAGHRADAYHSASAWLISFGLLGTMRRIVYDANYRAAFLLGDQR